MGSRKKHPGQGEMDDSDVRSQEVLRANRELAAYFKGRRTEREARAALKIIKAFVRDREKVPAAKRAPLPAAGSGRAAAARSRKSGAPAESGRQSST
jgi:hypothetical protein